MTASAVRGEASEAFAALNRVQHALAAIAGRPLVEVARRAVDGVYAAAAITGGGDERARVAYAFAQQMTVDVASITGEQRGAALAALGADAFEFVQAVYVLDFATRIRAAFTQLLGVDPIAVGEHRSAEASALWPALEELMRSIARLDALDPVTTELVRLRGARAHACRLCKSLRSVRALDGGADESTFDAIDRYETSALPEHQKVALRLTDSLIWQPVSYPDDLVTQVRAHWSTAQTVEIVLDVMRNAANKIAVALGADAAHVEDGVEYYDVDAHGDLVYGLTR